MQVKYSPWSIENESLSAWGFVIKEGRYKETVISINEVKLLENDENGVNLDYTVYKKPDDLSDINISEEEDFKEVLQYIIQDIIKRAIDEYENRNNNPTESNQQ